MGQQSRQNCNIHWSSTRQHVIFEERLTAAVGPIASKYYKNNCCETIKEPPWSTARKFPGAPTTMHQEFGWELCRERSRELLGTLSATLSESRPSQPQNRSFQPSQIGTFFSKSMCSCVTCNGHPGHFFLSNSSESVWIFSD